MKKVNNHKISIIMGSQSDYSTMKNCEKIFKNSGELINEISINPLKVRYILGFSNKSWKLVDFVSGL